MKAFSLLLPQRWIIFDSPCRQINSQLSFHRHRAPSSSHWYHWYPCYSLKISPTPLITQVTRCQKTLLYPCPRLYKLFADLPHDFDHYFYFGRSLTQKTTHTNDPSCIQSQCLFPLRLGVLRMNVWKGLGWLTRKTCNDMMSFALLPEEDHCVLWTRGTSGTPAPYPKPRDLSSVPTSSTNLSYDLPLISSLHSPLTQTCFLFVCLVFCF